jgi:putative RNA 2'-phosphotransferase
MDASFTKLSKLLSLVLRHKPQAIGISLDEAGWVDVEELINAINASGQQIDHELLVRIVRENDKQRFAFSEDGLQIRANQGHSVEIDLGLSPAEPPALLFHGTVGNFLDSIRVKGLIAGKRQHVHLSADMQTATIVGKRRGIPVVLTVDAGRMAADGMQFFVSQNGVWLTSHVPVTYINFP